MSSRPRFMFAVTFHLLVLERLPDIIDFDFSTDL